MRISPLQLILALLILVLILSRSVDLDRKGEPVGPLTASQKDLLHDYERIQYDLLYGKGYAASFMQ